MRFILAVSKDNKIALGGKLPWRIPHDFRWFKMNTYGETIIMGRKTWDSLPFKPLPNRRNIVLSKNTINNVEVYHNIDECINILKKEALSKIFVIAFSTGTGP